MTEPDPEVYLGGNYVVFDFETTTEGKGLSIYPGNRIVSVAWRCGPDHPSRRRGGGRRAPDHTHYKRSGEYDLGELVRDIEEADFCIAHNAKFDLGWLVRCGLDIGEVLVFDTMIAEYVLGGNSYVGRQLSLDSCAKRWFNEGKIDLIKKFWEAGIDTPDIPEEWLERYCRKDVELTERLFLEQRAKLHETGKLAVLYNRCLLTPVLVDIEKNGMQLDPDLVRTRAVELENEYAQLQRELDKLTGGINFNSAPQLGEYLYETLKFEEARRKVRGQWAPDRTPSGQPKTDAATLSKLKARTKEQKRFLDLYTRSREVWSELTKYLRKFQDCCDEVGGHLIASLNQTNTRTHRLSSTGLDYNAQMQNFPRAYKPLFRSRKDGWVIGECDGAQLEFRVAVHLGRDRTGLFDIITGTDIHNVTAGVIGCTRQEAKPHTFKPLYGGSSGTEDERRYYQFFKEKYTGVAEAQRTWIDTVLNTKSLVTEWGLEYHWPNTTMDRSGYVTNSTSICNYPVQAFATAEIIPMALVWFWHRVRRSDLQMFIINTVHDSIIVEMPEEEIDAFHELSQQCLIRDVYYMLDRLYGIAFTVPLGAGVSTGVHWGSKDETKYEAPEELWKEAANEAGMMQEAA